MSGNQNTTKKKINFKEKKFGGFGHFIQGLSHCGPVRRLIGQKLPCMEVLQRPKKHMSLLELLITAKNGHKCEI